MKREVTTFDPSKQPYLHQCGCHDLIRIIEVESRAKLKQVSETESSISDIWLISLRLQIIFHITLELILSIQQVLVANQIVKEDFLNITTDKNYVNTEEIK